MPLSISEIKTGVSEAFDTKSAELTTMVTELQNTVADLEAKNAASFSAGNSAHTPVEFKAALNTALKGALSGAEKKNNSFKLNSLDVKGLTLGGDSGEVLAIDGELGRTIIERARENVAILGAIAIKSVGSVDYRELVLRNRPASLADGIEQIAGISSGIASSNQDSTNTQSYEQVGLQVAKKYLKPFISNEAASDPHIDLVAELQRLLVEEMSRTWALQVLLGTGTGQNLRGILTARVDHAATTGESYKSNDARDFDIFPVHNSGASASLGATATAVLDLLVDITTELPTAYLQGAAWMMNRRTLGIVRKLKDNQGRPLVNFEAGVTAPEKTQAGFNGQSILGYPVIVEDYMPDVAADSLPIIFGDLSKAYALCNIDENMIVDPYTLDGAVQFKHEQRKGDIVQHNDAIVIVKVST